MTIVSIMSTVTTATPVAGLTDAWTWDVAHGWFRYWLAAASDGERGYQLSSRDHHCPELSRDVLAFCREHEPDLLAAAPFAVLPGFDSTGTDFDCVTAVIPTVARVNHDGIPELGDTVFAVFPAWHFEFSGDESEDEAAVRYAAIDTADIGRRPVPFLRMSYDVPSIGMGSVNPVPGIAEPEALHRAIDVLAGAGKGEIRCENFRRELVHLEWTPDGPVRHTDAGPRLVEQEALHDWAESFLRGNNFPAGGQPCG